MFGLESFSPIAWERDIMCIKLRHHKSIHSHLKLMKKGTREKTLPDNPKKKENFKEKRKIVLLKF